MDGLKVGGVVEVYDTRGTVRFLGETDFAPGIWAGIELEFAIGRNSGEVGGRRYFDCAENCGIFLRPESLSVPEHLSGLPSTLEVQTHRLRMCHLASVMELQRRKREYLMGCIQEGRLPEENEWEKEWSEIPEPIGKPRLILYIDSDS